MTTTKYRFFLVTFFLFITLTLFAQNGVEMKQPLHQPVKHKMVNNNNNIKIPFELYHNHIFINIKIENKNLRLIFDTGMPMEGAVLFPTEKVKNIDFQFSGEGLVGGVGGEPEMADFDSEVTFSLPSMELKNQSVLVMRSNPFTKGIIGEFDGVIGYTFFNRFVVGIDFDNNVLTLFKCFIVQQKGRFTINLQKQQFCKTEEQIVIF